MCEMFVITLRGLPDRAKATYQEWESGKKLAVRFKDSAGRDVVLTHADAHGNIGTSIGACRNATVVCCFPAVVREVNGLRAAGNWRTESAVSLSIESGVATLRTRAA